MIPLGDTICLVYTGGKLCCWGCYFIFCDCQNVAKNTNASRLVIVTDNSTLQPSTVTDSDL